MSSYDRGWSPATVDPDAVTKGRRDDHGHAGAVVDFRLRLPVELRPKDQRSTPAHILGRYDSILGVEATSSRSLSELLEDLGRHSIAHGVIHAEYEFGDPADAMNEAVARLCAEEPRLFSGVGTISLEDLRVSRALDQVRRVSEYGLIGINVQPAFFRLAPTDRRLYPVYALASELDLIVALHTGINYSTSMPMANDHPAHLDEIACDFPELRLVACHAGWPWATEMAAVARRHPNVYLEFGGLSPRYVAERGTGWDVMYRHMGSLLSGQILFASDWPVFPLDQALTEWRATSLSGPVKAKLLSQNAKKLLSLSEMLGDE